MKALSLARPWPELILAAGKTIENRTWTTVYRGPLLLHASKTWQGDRIGATTDVELDETQHPAGVVGVVDLVDICTAAANTADTVCQCGPWAMPHHNHWRLANPRRLTDPVPCSGQLGLWTPPGNVQAAVAARLDGAR